MLPRDIVRQIRRLHIRARRAVEDLLGGEYHSVFKGAGIAFEEVREYQPGDDVRAIDWNVTARMGHPFIKRFVEERELTVLILADATASMDFGLASPEAETKRTQAAQIAGAIALAAQINNDRVGLLTFGPAPDKFIPPRKGRQHVLRVIREVLTMDRPGAPSDLAAALAFAGRVMRRRTAIFVVSDFEVPDFEPQLRVVARRHDVHALVVRDPYEDRLVEGGIRALADPETGEHVFVNVSRAYAERHATAVKAHLDGVFRVLRRQRVPYTEFATRDPYDRPLVRHFARLKGKAL